MTNVLNLSLIFILLLAIGFVALMLFDSRSKARLKARRLISLSGITLQDDETKTSSINLWSRFIKSTESQISLAAVVALIFVGYFFNVPFMLELIVIAIATPIVWIVVRKIRISKLKKTFMARFPEAVDNFARSIKAGIPLEKALAVIGDTYDDALGARFRLLVQQMNLGLSFRQSLKNFTADLNNADVDFFCAVLALSRETGSPLSPMLAAFTGMLRERRAVERKLLTLTAESRASARVLCLIPLFIIGLQIFLNPSQISFLINDEVGRMVTGYCCLSMVVGFIVIQRMSRSLEG